jgi:hypothetical protein
MEDYNVNNNALTNNAVALLNNMLVELKRLKIDRILDTPFCRTIDHLSNQVENVKLLITENPRFEWVLIQKEMDSLFQRDRNLDGVYIKLSWRPGGNFGFIKGQIKKAS